MLFKNSYFPRTSSQRIELIFKVYFHLRHGADRLVHYRTALTGQICIIFNSKQNQKKNHNLLLIIKFFKLTSFYCPITGEVRTLSLYRFSFLYIGSTLFFQNFQMGRFRFFSLKNFLRCFRSNFFHIQTITLTLKKKKCFPKTRQITASKW